jgi:hypothetical protein
MEKPRESHEMKELKAFLEDAPEELKNLQVELHLSFLSCPEMNQLRIVPFHHHFSVD